MEPNDYHFLTRWSFAARIEEISSVLEDVDSLQEWWSSVYLQVETLETGSTDGIGRKVRLLTKGRLPYRLRWEFVVTESRPPHGFTLQATGDLVGHGQWRLTQSGDIAQVEFDWQVRAEKPVLRRFSKLLRPAFEWNHRWAMSQGQRCLCAELKRRRRLDGREVAQV